MYNDAMTRVLPIDPSNPDPATLQQAADVILAGGLVAFPTETVYGLGANALDGAAVEGIFRAKGRPATNPVIVHVADVSDVPRVAKAWPATAAALATHFWPGPLTLVLPRREDLPGVVTAGGLTVAVRCPAHPVAAALIRRAGVPIAAPSANRSTELSPTRAEHVAKSLAGRIDMILDGGPCTGGIESTVVDVTQARPRILRPGLVSGTMLEAIVGPLDVSEGDHGIARSPGQMAKHYSPRAIVTLFDSNASVPLPLPANMAWLAFGEAGDATIAMPTNPREYAAQLYQELHRQDDAGREMILITLPPDTPEWDAIRDRLRRAAAVM